MDIGRRAKASPPEVHIRHIVDSCSDQNWLFPGTETIYYGSTWILGNGLLLWGVYMPIWMPSNGFPCDSVSIDNIHSPLYFNLPDREKQILSLKL